MADFKVNADIRPDYLDHAVNKALHNIAADATRYQDTLTILNRWLGTYNLGIAEDVNGDWLFFHHMNLIPEKRYDTYQQALAGVLEELSARLPKVE